MCSSETALRHTTSQGIKISLEVAFTAAIFAGFDGIHLSPGEIQALVDETSARAMPQLSTLFAAVVGQVSAALRQSCTESLRRYVRDNKPPLDTPLAPAPAE